MSNNKWKSNLTSSSLPLEFEVAKLLVQKKFSVTSDFSYSRIDSGSVKDFSVDISATGYVPFKDPNKIEGEVSLLCECKYRTVDTKWFFLPDPNQPDMSPVTVGNTIRVIDEFSSHNVENNSLMSFDKELDYCYKGVEIKLEKGDVFDTEIKHGVSQLQYALPRLFIDMIKVNSEAFSEYSVPFFFCPILLTNSELFVCDTKIKIKDIEKAEKLEDIAYHVPYLVYYKDYGPDFETHCSKAFLTLKNSNIYEEIVESEEALKDKISFNERPSILISGLGNANRYWMKKYFTQFIVCNLKSFTKLVDLIKKTSTLAVKNKKKR